MSEPTILAMDGIPYVQGGASLIHRQGQHTMAELQAYNQYADGTCVTWLVLPDYGQIAMSPAMARGVAAMLERLGREAFGLPQEDKS